MKEIYSYAAGLIDGEGTITLSRNRKGSMRSPVVSVSSTTHELLSFFQEAFGGHIITLKRPKKQWWKQAWHWQISYHKALDVIIKVEPYLREPEKKRRALLLINNYRCVTPSNGKYTEEMLKKRIAFEGEFFKNSKKKLGGAYPPPISPLRPQVQRRSCSKS